MFTKKQAQVESSLIYALHFLALSETQNLTRKSKPCDSLQNVGDLIC